MNNEALTKLSYGVYIVTTLADNDKPTGCTANSAMQVTADPAAIAVSINHNNYTNKCIKDKKQFALNVLGEKTDPLVIGTFGFRSGNEYDKFENKEPVIKDGLPIINDAIAYITCSVIDSFETDTHTIFIGKVIDADILTADDEPMTYSYYHRIIKGSAPKNAPTYIEK